MNFYDHKNRRKIAAVIIAIVIIAMILPLLPTLCRMRRRDYEKMERKPSPGHLSACYGKLHDSLRCRRDDFEKASALTSWMCLA